MKIKLIDWIKLGISFGFSLASFIRQKRKKKCQKENANDVFVHETKTEIAKPDPKPIPKPPKKDDPIAKPKRTTIKLKRKYHPEGTNGTIKANGKTYHTIELPWKDNVRSISCIEEGVYRLTKRYSERFKNHIHVLDVPGREWILIHPANDAKEELRGCIAIVEQHWAPGRGGMSANVTGEFRDYVYQLIDRGHEVYLEVTS